MTTTFPGYEQTAPEKRNDISQKSIGNLIDFFIINLVALEVV